MTTTTGTRPALTRDGVTLAPLAGGFLPPYSERLHLIAHLPAPSAADLAAMSQQAGGSEDAASQPHGTQVDTAQAATGEGSPFSPETAAAMEAFNAPFGQPEATHAVVEEREVDGPHGPVPVRVYRPEPGWVPPAPSPQADGLRTGLVWYHGGAFVGGDLDMPEADAVARGLVTRTGATVVSVFYRLCNDGVTHFPVPHDDAYAALRWTAEHARELGIDPARLAVGGASAGGNLAGGVALRARDDAAATGRHATVWQALPAYPVAQAEHWPAASGELAQRLEDMPQVLRFPADVMAMMNANYLGAAPVDAPAYAFPGDGNGSAADLAGFPASYIENCENDDLRASGEALGQALAQAGCDVECVTAAGVPHGHLNAVGSALSSQSLDRFAARLARRS